MHSKPTQLLCRHLIKYCADTRGVTAGVAREQAVRRGGRSGPARGEGGPGPGEGRSSGAGPAGPRVAGGEVGRAGFAWAGILGWAGLVTGPRWFGVWAPFALLFSFLC